MLPNVIISKWNAQKFEAEMLQNPIRVDSPAVTSFHLTACELSTTASV